MKTLYQLLRQPLKTLLLVLLVALALAILVVCVGQYSATILTRAELDDKYDTVAVLSDEYFWSSLPSGGQHHASELPDEIQAWIAETIAARTDLVKVESFPQLYSAYAPDLWHDNFSRYADGDNFEAFGITVGNPYRCAMLEVTLTQVGTVLKEDTIVAQMADGRPQEFTESITMLCIATVDQAVALEQGFASPVGKTIVLTIQVDSKETLAAMKLTTGERYLVYGLDFTDTPGGKSQDAATSLKQYEELFGSAGKVGNKVDWTPILEQIECSMTVCDFASLPDVVFGNSGLELRPDLRMYTYREGDEWVTQSIIAEEFIKKYSLPTIAPLQSTAEEFLESEEAFLWRKALDEMEYNLHGFPVLAVDKLGYQLAFARGEARIVEGRDFTENERTESSHVCIISEAVALASGLSVGETIDLQTYGLDVNVGSGQDNKFFVSHFPTAALYSSALGFTSGTVQYTIVGLYRQNNAWQDEGQPGGDAHGFSPDVIFVPKGSVSGEHLIGTSGIMYSLVLHNGKMAEFQILQEEAGYPDLFVCMDGGYSEILVSLDAYESVSGNAFWVGISTYGVLMVLLLLFVSLQQRRTLTTMGFLGACRSRRILHVMESAIYILLPGSVMGGVAGAFLWKRVAAKLMDSVHVTIPLQANMAQIAPVLIVVHMVLMAFCILLAAIPMTGSRLLIKRT